MYVLDSNPSICNLLKKKKVDLELFIVTFRYPYMIWFTPIDGTSRFPYDFA